MAGFLVGDMLRRSATRVPHRRAIVAPEREQDYAALEAMANRVAHAMLAAGIGPGRNAAIMATNHFYYPAIHFGAARTGGILCHVNVRSTADDVAFMLEKTDVDLVFVEAAFAGIVAAARPRLSRLKQVVVFGGAAGDDCVPFEDFIAGQPDSTPDVDIDERTAFAVTFTGGTTGFPKAVVSTHRARHVTANTVLGHFGLEDRDIVACVTPLFHAAALSVMFQSTIMLGLTCVLQPSWDPDEFMDLVERESVTTTFLVPTQINGLISHPAFDPARLKTLRKVNYAGAPMPLALIQRAMTVLPDVAFTENYGASEVGGPMTVRQSWDVEKAHTVGRPVFNVDVAVVDAESGEPVPRGSLGEVVTRGEHVTAGYYNDPEQTAALYRGQAGWLYTGDIGMFDEDGFLVISDRSKDMIVSGAENIYPAEVENALYKHDVVAECAVFGVPDDHWGEVPAAHVVLRADAVATDETETLLIEFVAGRIPRHKRPRFIKFVDALPKTAVGKVQKNLIRAPYWQGRGKKI
ncbi:MAG: class I adenylate-forming enzyme family protein [Candidatus Eiseniibacteriota bacterium]